MSRINEWENRVRAKENVLEAEKQGGKKMDEIIVAAMKQLNEKKPGARSEQKLSESPLDMIVEKMGLIHAAFLLLLDASPQTLLPSILEKIDLSSARLDQIEEHFLTCYPDTMSEKLFDKVLNPDNLLHKLFKQLKGDHFFNELIELKGKIKTLIPSPSDNIIDKFFKIPIDDRKQYEGLPIEKIIFLNELSFLKKKYEENKENKAVRSCLTYIDTLFKKEGVFKAKVIQIESKQAALPASSSLSFFPSERQKWPELLRIKTIKLLNLCMQDLPEQIEILNDGKPEKRTKAKLQQDWITKYTKQSLGELLFNLGSDIYLNQCLVDSSIGIQFLEKCLEKKGDEFTHGETIAQKAAQRLVYIYAGYYAPNNQFKVDHLKVQEYLMIWEDPKAKKLVEKGGQFWLANIAPLPSADAAPSSVMRRAS